MRDVSINTLLGNSNTDYLLGNSFNNLCVYRGIRQEMINQGLKNNLIKNTYQLMINIATHPDGNASTNHHYVDPNGNVVDNLSIYHFTFSDHQERTTFTGTLFFVAVDKNNITIPLTYVTGGNARWKRNNLDGSTTDFYENDPNLIYLYFGVGNHTGANTHTYRVISADSARFTDFSVGSNVEL